MFGAAAPSKLSSSASSRGRDRPVAEAHRPSPVQSSQMAGARRELSATTIRGARRLLVLDTEGQRRAAITSSPSPPG